MINRNIEKLEAITLTTLVVGIDIAKEKQWARFVDYRGLEIGKFLKFHNDRSTRGRFFCVPETPVKFV